VGTLQGFGSVRCAASGFVERDMMCYVGFRRSVVEMERGSSCLRRWTAL
jgi:hypothetical protein